MQTPEDFAFGQCQALAAAVGAEPALPEIGAFLDCFRSLQPRSGELGSIVAENGAPFELSLSSRDLSSLRLLGEAACFGESIVGNLRRNYLLFQQLNKAFQLCEADRFDTLIRELFPPGELLNQLQWKFTFYTSIRADGRTQPAFRFYFNLLWESNEHRVLRALSALRCLDTDCDETLRRLYGLTAGWGDIVGISIDSINGALVPAKLHFSIRRSSRYRLALLRNWLHLEDSDGLLEWYLSAYPGAQSEAVPYLFSIELGGQSRPGLKIDMVLRGLQSPARHAMVEQALRRAEARDLRSLTDESLGDIFKAPDADGAQYLGVNFALSNAPYVNCYFSAARPTARTAELEDWETAALTAVTVAQTERGAYRHEGFDFGPRGRQNPANGGDVYMTALIQQCAAELWPGRVPQVESQCCSFLLETKTDRGWSYLPGLPVDVDDSAMALVTLQQRMSNLSDHLFEELALQQLPSGGFRTFFDLEDDPAHFSVTANAVLALAPKMPAAAGRGLTYLRRALSHPDETQNQWMYSAVFPLYLLMRVARQLEDVPLFDEIARRVSTLRREDGLWGNGVPECFESAIALLTLHACGVLPDDVGAIARHLSRTQREDGTWPWAPIYSDGDGHWFGQTAASTIVCAGALAIAIEATGARS